MPTFFGEWASLKLNYIANPLRIHDVFLKCSLQSQACGIALYIPYLKRNDVYPTDRATLVDVAVPRY